MRDLCDKLWIGQRETGVFNLQNPVDNPIISPAGALA